MEYSDRGYYKRDIFRKKIDSRPLPPLFAYGERSPTPPPKLLCSFPDEWFKTYMETMKKDMVREVSNEVIRNVTEILNKRLIMEPSTSPQFHCAQDKPLQHQNMQHDCPISDSLSVEEEQRKMQNELLKNESANVAGLNKESTHLTHESKRKLQKQLDYTLGKLQENMQIESINNLDKGDRKQKDNVLKKEMTVKEELYPNAKLSSLQSESAEALHSKQDLLDVPVQSENQLRMNCSVTGHRILNKTHAKDTMTCSGSDIDNISICSIASNNSDMQSENDFEVLHVPLYVKSERTGSSILNILCKGRAQSDCSENESNATRYSHAKCEADNNENSSSPSFELLPESASPMLSVHNDANCSCHNENTIDHDTTRRKEFTVIKQCDAKCTLHPIARSSISRPEPTKESNSRSDSLNVPRSVDKKLRMNCSITGHEMLNETSVKNVMLCSASDKNSTDLSLSALNNSDSSCEHSFEIIDMPPCSGEPNTFNNTYGTVHEKKIKNDSLTDEHSTSSPRGNLERQPDTISPALPSYVNENHFSCNGNDIRTWKKVYAIQDDGSKVRMFRFVCDKRARKIENGHFTDKRNMSSREESIISMPPKTRPTFPSHGNKNEFCWSKNDAHTISAISDD